MSRLIETCLKDPGMVATRYDYNEWARFFFNDSIRVDNEGAPPSKRQKNNNEEDKKGNIFLEAVDITTSGLLRD